MANLDNTYDVDYRTKAFENHKKGVLVSLAGPGTGKTYSLLKHIKALTERGVNENSICYLTFIKEISNAFISDYIDEFGTELYETNKPRISTLHSLACRLLRNQGFHMGFDGELYFSSITDSEDGSSKIFIQDLLPLVTSVYIHTPRMLRDVLVDIKSSWQNFIDLKPFEESQLIIFSTFLELLRCYRLIDWDQVIYLANGFVNNKQKLPSWISQINHLLIDEYQDFNKAEQAFITSLIPSTESVIIVGDDNQSLYSKRGGSPKGIKDLFFSADCDQITLQRCRRCKSKIVEAANTFMTAMRTDPRLMLPFSEGGDISCLYFKSTKSEIEYLVYYLTNCIKSLPENPKPKDGIVCLFPSWRMLDFYFNKLSQFVPCCKRKTPPSSTRLWLQRSLELICRPNQRFLERLILEEYKSIKPRHKKMMVGLIIQNDISPTDALETLVRNEQIVGEVASQVEEFCEFCNALSSGESTNIAKQLSEHLKIDIHIIFEKLEIFFQENNDFNQEEKIKRFCDELIPESALPPESPNAILFLTMHGSKGLTKNTVVMPGLEKAWLPGNDDKYGLEEKMRQFYVSITRATDHVLITYPRHRARGDPLNFNIPGQGEISPFVRMSNISCKFQD